MNVDIAVVSAKHQMSICVMVTLVILTIYMEMTMNEIIEFIEEVYEIAFGDDAINRDFTYGEVLEELRDNSDRAWGISKDGR